MIKRLLIRLGFIPKPIPNVPVAVSTPAPHEQYPEVMHWKQGDEIRSHTRCHHYFWFNLISVTANGMVYGQNQTGHHKCSYALWVIMRDGVNLSLRDRQIDEVLKDSNEYMELIAQFNAAFAELQERDKGLKLVS